MVVSLFAKTPGREAATYAPHRNLKSVTLLRRALVRGECRALFGSPDSVPCLFVIALVSTAPTWKVAHPLAASDVPLTHQEL